ncbi:DUF2779 domain-containing protein [Maribacter sp. MJ134]|uniref:DUF2779 domain-containing protein n=1 Tax=Maribacter sp. MJ134 TaxID=2496865 RepID=UPI000F81C860|nr:DUF2779 domain-containing protein [Maribacter sp. MJ134]AZQ59861.1 DUF2779 domain-containing protein [Maribacter sp. MJ134]
MQLTKTDFIHYLQCPESLWFKKNKPEDYPEAEQSLFLKKLTEEGYEVEAYAAALFENPVDLPEFLSTTKTKEALAQYATVFLQPSFKTETGLYARIDILEKLENDTWHLYEVKSSSKVSRSKNHDHVFDLCFQKNVLEQNGISVVRCSVIHVNSNYLKQGEIKPKEFLAITEVTQEVAEVYSTSTSQINDAIDLLSKEYLELKSCSCLCKTRTNHCDAFSIFNPGVTSPSIYELKRISEKKITNLVIQNALGFKTIPKDFELSTYQKLQLKSFEQGKAIINTEGIQNTLAKLEFPLHFYDYEAYGSAVPRLNGTKPFEQIPFQVSMHTLSENGELTHFEYLADTLEFPSTMIEQMEQFTDKQGTFVSWHASYENSANDRMMEWMPRFKEYLTYINKNTFDLEKLFQKEYVDYRFKGSSSIKKILPVLVPELSYDTLEVKDGTMAMDTWGKIAFNDTNKEEKEQIRQDLLEYCKLDSLAMVEIFNYLKTL